MPTPNEDWDRVIEELASRDAGITDGNYGRTLSARLAACDTVIFLDLPRHVAFGVSWAAGCRIAATRVPTSRPAVRID
ncbi:MAG: hypothetical protein ACT4P6_06775 [Gemmatimonadaceae bacterium]